MKPLHLILTLTTVLMFTKVNSQTLLINAHFLNSTNNEILADYQLNCDGKTIYSGQSTEKLELNLNLNKTYILVVSKKDFKTKTIFFSIKPELNHDEYFFEFDVLLTEKMPSQSVHPKNETVIFHYNTGMDDAFVDSSSPNKI
jgi:hypothetical protein